MIQLCLPLFSRDEIKRTKLRIKNKRYHRKHLEQISKYQREYQRQWQKMNRDKSRKYQRRWAKTHRKEINEARKQWWAENRDHCREYLRQYQQKHPEIRKAGKERYNLRHSKIVKERIMQWRRDHPENMKATQSKHKAKRRYLGFVPLNPYFEGSEAHHVDKVHVVYIPKSLHESIYHNVWNGHGMDKINAKVFEWLSQESRTVPLLEVMSATS